MDALSLAVYKIPKYHGIIIWYHQWTMVSHNTFFFCKGDWTKEFLFFLPWGSWGWSWSIPCGWCFSRAAPGLEGLVPAGRQKEPYHFIEPTPKTHSMLLTKSNTYGFFHASFMRPWMWWLYSDFMSLSVSMVVVTLDELLFLCAGEILVMQFIWITVITLNTFLIQIWGIESGVCCSC